MRQWRLIYDIPTNGAVNMAVDAAILDAVSAGRVLPTLRLYCWEPPCLSLGYGQRARDVDLERLETHGWDIVRRPTGGKAILHTDELTYSVSLPIDHPLAAGGVIESYREISKALLAALSILGAKVQADAKQHGVEIDAVCFATPSHYEITVNRKKLVGSAQLRRKAGVLQHGTLPLYGDLTRICEVLHYENEDARERAKRLVRERATTLEKVLPSPRSLRQQGEGSMISPHPRPLSLRERGEIHEHEDSSTWSVEDAKNRTELWQIAAEAVVRGFQDAFGIAFEVGTLTDGECENAAQLKHDVYGNEAWTMRR